MTLISLLYTSRNRIDPAQELAVMRDIVADARANNLSDRITGALLFTGDAFAQVLEGKSDVVEPLMARIAVDPRHDDVRIVEKKPIELRQFGSWSLAYLGRFVAGSRYIDDANAASREDAPERLIAFIRNGASASLDG